MAAAASTTLSLSAFLLTLSLSRGTTATCENTAPAGFQHLVHPHTWLNAHWAVTVTSTGLLVHWHTSVPPPKLAEPGLTPLSTAGWIEMFAMICPPKFAMTHCAPGRSRSRQDRAAPKIALAPSERPRSCEKA